MTTTDTTPTITVEHTYTLTTDRWQAGVSARSPYGYGGKVYAYGQGTTEQEAIDAASAAIPGLLAGAERRATRQAASRDLLRVHLPAAMALMGRQAPLGCFREPGVQPAVGDAVWLWGHGAWRNGIVADVSPTGKRLRVVYVTPSQHVPHLTGWTGDWFTGRK
jgi:hypothetical protein